MRYKLVQVKLLLARRLPDDTHLRCISLVPRNPRSMTLTLNRCAMPRGESARRAMSSLVSKCSCLKVPLQNAIFEKKPCLRRRYACVCMRFCCCRKIYMFSVVYSPISRILFGVGTAFWWSVVQSPWGKKTKPKCKGISKSFCSQPKITFGQKWVAIELTLTHVHVVSQARQQARFAFCPFARDKHLTLRCATCLKQCASEGPRSLTFTRDKRSCCWLPCLEHTRRAKV